MNRGREAPRPRGGSRRPHSFSSHEPARRSKFPRLKRWGQHFLVSDATAERIAAAARLDPSDTVIEVGPGDGALTRPLAKRAGRVLAIEIDPLRAEALARELAGSDHVRVVYGDVQEREFGAWLAAAGWPGPAVLVGNLPYNAATPILIRAIGDSEAIVRCVATVQREVARRFTAKVGDEEYGYLSVRAAAFATGRVLFDLPAGAFRPRPKVVSSVLELLGRPFLGSTELRDRALALASRGFRWRRKTLANALASDGGRARWEGALEALGKSIRARAEELSWEDYVSLARLAANP